MTKMLLTVALLCASLSLRQPDQVIQWNRTLLQILQTPGAQPASVHPTRSMAIVHLAIYDAVNAIRGGHAPYLVSHAPRSASPDAAAAAAAHTALLSLFPNQQSVIDAKFQDSLSQIGGGAHVRQGIRVGKEAANAILAARADDGSDSTPSVFGPQSGPGEYQLTPPNFHQPVFTNWPDVRPFALESGDRFRPPPPPAVTSPRYTTDFDEIKSLGEINSTRRSAEQTDIGRFWGAAPVQNVWNQTLRLQVRVPPLASRHGGPGGRQRRQPGHDGRSQLDPAGGDGAGSELRRRPCRNQPVSRRHPPRFPRHRPPGLLPHQSQPSGRRAELPELLGGR